jgi:PleD family two-component response regulator
VTNYDDAGLDRIRRYEAAKQRLETAQLAAATDPLTGVFKRAATGAYIQGLLDAGRPVGIAGFCVERLKCVNAEHGCECGDRILDLVASIVAQCGRPEVIGRWSGASFVVVAPDGAPDACVARFLDLWTATRDAHPDEAVGRVRLLVGCATSQPGDTPELLVERALGRATGEVRVRSGASPG